MAFLCLGFLSVGSKNYLSLVQFQFTHTKGWSGERKMGDITTVTVRSSDIPNNNQEEKPGQSFEAETGSKCNSLRSHLGEKMQNPFPFLDLGVWRSEIEFAATLSMIQNYTFLTPTGMDGCQVPQYWFSLWLTSDKCWRNSTQSEDHYCTSYFNRTTQDETMLE